MRNIYLFFLVVSFVPLLAQEGTDVKLPAKGTVTADKVNLRCGPGTEFRSFFHLNRGDKLTVVKRKGDWYAVKPPAGVFFFIHKRYVSKGKKSTEGYEGEVLGNNVNVRSGIGDKDRVMGQLNRGDKVLIVGEKEQWFKIRPPEGMFVWMAAKYVKLERRLEKKGPDNEKSSVKPGEKTEKEKALEREAEELRRQVEELMAKLDAKKSELEAIRKEREDWERRYERIRRKLEEADRKEQELREKYEKKIKEILERKPEKPKATRYTAIGVIYDFGALVTERPGGATHKLKETRDGPVKYYLKPARSDIKLDDYLFKQVGIIGRVEKIENREERLLIVEEIEILSK